MKHHKKGRRRNPPAVLLSQFEMKVHKIPGKNSETYLEHNIAQKEFKRKIKIRRGQSK